MIGNSDERMNSTHQGGGVVFRVNWVCAKYLAEGKLYFTYVHLIGCTYASYIK